MTDSFGTPCDGERITGYVDGVLDAEARREVEAHLGGCPTCRDQLAFEEELRVRLRGLPLPETPASLEGRVRKSIRPARFRAARFLLPLAATFVLVVLWARNAAPFVAWELARDHAHCFGMQQLPAKVWSEDPDQVAAWLGKEGVEMPVVPSAAGGLNLVGARQCPLLDRRVAHLYYAGEKDRLSLYVVPGTVRFKGGYTVSPGGRHVHLLRTGGMTVGLVSEDADTLAEFRRSFLTTVARRPAGPLPTVDPSARSLLRWASTRVGL